jgi:hypothetical protein
VNQEDKVVGKVEALFKSEGMKWQDMSGGRMKR